MLGHIAIAALGGFYAQDPESGSVADTYVPASSIRMSGLHTWTTDIDAQDAVFEHVFDDTQVYAKSEFLMPAAAVTYPRLVLIGTTKYRAELTNQRTWWFAGACTSPTNGRKQFCLYVNENILDMGAYRPSDGIIICWSQKGERAAHIVIRSEEKVATVSRFPSFSMDSALLQIGSSHSYVEQNFYVASLVNDYYHAYYMVSPMASLSGASVALFEHFNPSLLEL